MRSTALLPARFFRHGLRAATGLTAVAVWIAVSLTAMAQTSFTSTSAATAWNAARWNNSADGPTYASTYTANNAVSFTSGTYSFAGMGASTNVGNITVADTVTVNFPSVNSSIATGGNIRTITVGSSGLLDLQGQGFSTAAGTGFIKNGSGVLALAGGDYPAGFTLNNGTVIARGVDAFGANASNVLTLNGGVVASNSSRSFANTKHGGGIVIGGNVQFGELATVVSIASSSANLTFANNVSLGGANRTLTLGNNGNQGFSGVISNGSLTFAANPGADGRFEITNIANTFTGNININGGEVRFTADGSMGNAANAVVIDGGRFATNGGTFTLGADRSVFVGDTAGTSISTPGSGVFTVNNVISDIAGKTGFWAKQGGGTLELGGASTYTGETLINNGIVRLTAGNNRLPTSTFVRLGQAASTNVGRLDLNGNDQTIAGLASTSGDNTAPTANNTVTSVNPATLTVALASGTATYGDGTAASSGLITGAVSLVKTGAGVQVLGGVNTYTGGTTINAGTLSVAADAALGGSTGGITLGGGTLEMTSGFTLGSGRTITATPATTSRLAVTTGTVSYAGGFTGSGNLDKIGAGQLTVSNASSDYTGLFTISAGTLEVTGANAFANATLRQTGGTLLLAPVGGGDVTIPDLDGSSGTTEVGAGVTAVVGNAGNSNYSGRIRGQGGLKKEASSAEYVGTFRLG